MFDISGADNGEQTGAFCRHRQRGGGDLFPASGEVADPISGSGGEIGGSDGAGFAPGGEDVGHEGRIHVGQFGGEFIQVAGQPGVAVWLKHQLKFPVRPAPAQSRDRAGQLCRVVGVIFNNDQLRRVEADREAARHAGEIRQRPFRLFRVDAEQFGAVKRQPGVPRLKAGPGAAGIIPALQPDCVRMESEEPVRQRGSIVEQLP